MEPARPSVRLAAQLAVAGPKDPATSVLAHAWIGTEWSAPLLRCRHDMGRAVLDEMGCEGAALSQELDRFVYVGLAVSEPIGDYLCGSNRSQSVTLRRLLG